MYRIEFTSAAARQVRKLDRPARTRLLDAIESLAHSPRCARGPTNVSVGSPAQTRNSGLMRDMAS